MICILDYRKDKILLDFGEFQPHCDSCLPIFTGYFRFSIANAQRCHRADNLPLICDYCDEFSMCRVKC